MPTCAYSAIRNGCKQTHIFRIKTLVNISSAASHYRSLRTACSSSRYLSSCGRLLQSKLYFIITMSFTGLTDTSNRDNLPALLAFESLEVGAKAGRGWRGWKGAMEESNKTEGDLINWPLVAERRSAGASYLQVYGVGDGTSVIVTKEPMTLNHHRRKKDGRKRKEKVFFSWETLTKISCFGRLFGLS